LYFAGAGISTADSGEVMLVVNSLRKFLSTVRNFPRRYSSNDSDGRAEAAIMEDSRLREQPLQDELTRRDNSKHADFVDNLFLFHLHIAGKVRKPLTCRQNQVQLTLYVLDNETR